MMGIPFRLHNTRVNGLATLQTGLPAHHAAHAKQPEVYHVTVR